MDKETAYPMHVGIVVTSAAQLASVYALLGASALAGAMAAPAVAAAAAAEPAPTAAAPAAGETASENTDGEVDAGGWSWSADLHASTKGKTKDGYWRMKVGVTRPADKPGFLPSNAAAAAPASPKPSPSASAGDAGAASTPAAEASSDDDDEFAAFREAAAKTDAEAGAAAAAVPARKWTDADLGALCNQAAVKLGDPSPIKEIIAQFVAEGEVAHSRNIAEDKRADFAAAVEAKAGITFAG